MQTAYLGRMVFPTPGESIEDGVIVVEDGRIVDVGRQIPAQADVVDLNALPGAQNSGVAILPGLINTHTHLEFSDLASPLGKAGMRFPDWIREVIKYRLATQGDSPAQQPDPQRFLHGLRECVRTGTTTLGDIAKPNTPWELLNANDAEMSDVDCSVTAFIEFLGLANDRPETAIAELESSVARLKRDAPSWKVGISPHAPYSTHWRLVEALCRHARAHALPVAMHLAESPEELEFMRSHTGPFQALLSDIGVWNPEGVPHGARPLDYLQQLADVPRSLVIHGNYLTSEEIEFIAGCGNHMSVVYCPRTHSYFQHADYPLAKMLNAGVNVVLGTDSRASTPDLDLMQEMRHVADKHPDISPESILHMATTGGALALGCADRTGALQPGKDADLAVFSLDDEHGGLAALLSSGAPCLATMTRGKLTTHG